MAKAVGHKAIYLSRGGVAANSLGLPDLGISSLDDVLTDVNRITFACDLPLLVDADTQALMSINTRHVVGMGFVFLLVLHGVHID